MIPYVVAVVLGVMIAKYSLSILTPIVREVIESEISSQ